MNNNIRVQFVKIPVSESLNTYIENKVSTLIEHYPFIKSGTVFIKKELKNIERECVCELELHVPGKQLFASSNERHFEAAVKETIKQMTHQLKRTKETVFVRH
ncbi:HPF/RaiA family ribosome-associated protein [Spongiivirga sp. MCCC 1A20706]|uniref:HPF/RaiA family ribosome-associated protein n=1 Tax=Spongiivirga sp. MCCC 1A20706 TaxID=3160963 RepID=UPI003977D67C